MAAQPQAGSEGTLEEPDRTPKNPALREHPQNRLVMKFEVTGSPHPAGAWRTAAAAAGAGAFAGCR
jgi:hypothetical protein